jgi:hypothetical protein
MTKLHMKAYMLCLLRDRGEMWDYDLANAVMEEYGLSGDYWYGTVRLTLTDLFSGGLVNEVETTVDVEKSFGREKVLFRFALTEFGVERMQQTGLLEGATA